MSCSTILLKKSYSFKIVELKKILSKKLITDSAILNKWELFSEMVDKWRDLPKDYIISRETNWSFTVSIFQYLGIF